MPGARVAIERLYVCDGCEATITCGAGSLVARWKWRRYIGKRDEGHGLLMDWELLLCPDCQPT